jgi:signal transduction histidine kinase
MSLRFRLALALLFAALLPMTVVVGIPLLRADARAKEDAQRRLALAQSQVEFLYARLAQETEERAEHAAAELARDKALLAPVLAGPEAGARATAAALAQRHGLDWVELVAADDTVLAALDPERRIGERRDLASLPEDGATLAAWPGPRRSGAGILLKRAVPSARETVWLAAGRRFDREPIEGMAELTGQSVALVAPSGEEILSAGPKRATTALVAELAPGGSGWRIAIKAPAGDAGRERRDLLSAFAGLAPLALVSAVVAGAVMAARIARPIRVLADQADEISESRDGFRMLPSGGNEVTRLTGSFDRMLDALERSERQRVVAERVAAWEQVARRIAHEVKNPLSPIQLAVENLRRTRAKAPAELDRALEVETATILEEVASLRRLVDEFSQFARLPRPSFAACDPRKLVEQALALYAPRIESLRVDVRVSSEDAPARIVADAEQMGRVLKNVLANALDALEGVRERRLDVTLRRETRGGAAFARFEFRDHGVGLDAEAARRIFEPYFTTRAERGGTGLGMAIAHRIVSDHGGSIEVAGAAGEGATVTIRLPEAGPLSAGS